MQADSFLVSFQAIGLKSASPKDLPRVTLFGGKRVSVRHPFAP